jgi:hypothetical protein
MRFFSFQVIITRNEGQGLTVASKNLWDSSVDNYSTYCFKNVK